MACTTDDGIQVIGVPDFWASVCRAGNRFLGLDYDGTLAPFHAEPMRAQPLPGVREILTALRDTQGTILAVISGRPVAEVLTLLGERRITVIGSHGCELYRPDGTLVEKRPQIEQQEGLTLARTLAEDFGLEGRLETKVASLAFHTRGMASGKALRLEQGVFSAWSRISGAHGLECRAFNGGVEIRAAGWHKGDAFSNLLADQPEGTLTVYVGDDETDEDAFRAIRTRGIGIKVGNLFTPTAARGFLLDCRAVRDFLVTWLSVTTNSCL